MANFVLRRIVGLIMVIWGISTVAFFILRLTGDPTSLFLTPDAPPEAFEDLREEMGFNDPLSVQYVRFLAGIPRGEFGESIRHKSDAFDLVVDRLPATLELAAAGMAVAILAGVPLGIVATVKRNTLFETGAMATALFGQSVPNFWLGLMMIIVLGVNLGWFPISGRESLKHLIMPAIAVGVFPMARIARLLRAGLIEQLQQDYVRAARAKGLSSLAVTLYHALVNAAIPVVTLIGIDFGRLLGGSVIVETVFAWPGAGLLAVRAVSERDFPVVQASVFVLGLLFVVVNTLMDIVYVLIDPRIDFERSGS